jgi:hypothetical protein
MTDLKNAYHTEDLDFDESDLCELVMRLNAGRRSPEHCQTCGMTDGEYAHTGRVCPDPWHADERLRAG